LELRKIRNVLSCPRFRACVCHADQDTAGGSYGTTPRAVRMSERRGPPEQLPTSVHNAFGMTASEPEQPLANGPSPGGVAWGVSWAASLAAGTSAGQRCAT
jgi:hypothetical protein